MKEEDLGFACDVLNKAQETIRAWNVAEEVTRELTKKGLPFLGAMGIADKLFDRDDWRWDIAVSASYRLIRSWNVVTEGTDRIIVEDPE